MEGEKRSGKEGVGSGAADPNYVENSKNADREAQGGQGVSNNCRESASHM